MELLKHPYPLRLGSNELPLGHNNSQRFRMTGAACEGRFGRGIEPTTPRGDEPAFPTNPFGPITVLKSVSAFGGRRTLSGRLRLV